MPAILAGMAFLFPVHRFFSKPFRTGFVLLLALFALPSLAWGPQGHRLVGALAEAELRPDARREVSHLLAGEPEPTLAGIANWADDLRDSDPLLYRRTARWHFVNIAEEECRYARWRDCPGGDCVVEAIRRQTAILADRRQSLAARRDALKFVVHFVGDVHQPLHAGYARDRGGNDTQLNDAGFGTNLHALWDSRLLTRQRRSDTAYQEALSRLPLAVPLARRALPPTAAGWAEESCLQVLRPGFYPPRPALDAAYFTQWTPTAELRLRQAGTRLAQLLNAALAG